MIKQAKTRHDNTQSQKTYIKKIFPFLRYGPPCWFASVDGLKRLEGVQKYADIWMIGKSNNKTGLLTLNL